jgi:hypothetical protein
MPSPFLLSLVHWLASDMQKPWTIALKQTGIVDFHWHDFKALRWKKSIHTLRCQSSKPRTSTFRNY